MEKIKNIKGRQVFDSRGNPTIETEVHLTDGSSAISIVPSGASKGKHEAFELRDINDKKYMGMGVSQALDKINGEIKKKVIGLSIENQEEIDKALINLDGTKQKKDWEQMQLCQFL